MAELQKYENNRDYEKRTGSDFGKCCHVILDGRKNGSNRDVCYGMKMEGAFDFFSRAGGLKTKRRFNIKVQSVF